MWCFCTGHRPAITSLANALPASRPITPGTLTTCGCQLPGGAFAIETATVEPVGTFAPGAGDCANAVPGGWFENWLVNCPLSPSEASTCWIVGTFRPNTLGTWTCAG